MVSDMFHRHGSPRVLYGLTTGSRKAQLRKKWESNFDYSNTLNKYMVQEGGNHLPTKLIDHPMTHMTAIISQ